MAGEWVSTSKQLMPFSSAAKIRLVQSAGPRFSPSSARPSDRAETTVAGLADGAVAHLPYPSRSGTAGLQRKRVQFPAHLAAERGIDHLVLANPRQAAELLRADPRAIVVAVAREVVDADLGVGEGRPKAGLQLLGGHGHERISSPP